MHPVCAIARTPVGYFPAPMDPGFVKRLAGCEVDEDLYLITVGTHGYDPDGINEIDARHLGDDFRTWLSANAKRVDGGWMCRKNRHLWWDRRDALHCCNGRHVHAVVVGGGEQQRVETGAMIGRQWAKQGS